MKIRSVFPQVMPQANQTPPGCCPEHTGKLTCQVGNLLEMTVQGLPCGQGLPFFGMGEVHVFVFLGHTDGPPI